MNLYKMLWSRIGGRPWTYIWRDIYHEAEWLIQGMWFWGGAALTIFLCDQFSLLLDTKLVWIALGIVWGIYTFGYINGHFHWGTKWIKGQKGNGSRTERSD